MLKLRSFIQCKYAVPASRNVSIGVVPSIGSPTRNDFEVNPRFVNRNPRNLEQMLLARKPVGWEWDRPSRTYWYRLEIQLAKRNVFGKVVHNSGSCVTEASTTEWGIKKQLVSTADKGAAFAVGRVLARRCLEAGVLAVHVDIPEEKKTSKKVQSLLDGFSKEGVALKEPGDLNETEDRPLVTMYR